MKVSIVGSLRDREVACSASDRQGSNFESCVWRTVSSQSSHHPQEVLLAQFSLYVHKGGLKPDSFHFISFPKPSQYLHFLTFLYLAHLIIIFTRSTFCGEGWDRVYVRSKDSYEFPLNINLAINKFIPHRPNRMANILLVVLINCDISTS